MGLERCELEKKFYQELPIITWQFFTLGHQNGAACVN